jgi:hypothetical protein
MMAACQPPRSVHIAGKPGIYGFGSAAVSGDWHD